MENEKRPSSLKKIIFWGLVLVVSIFLQIFLLRCTLFDASIINIIFTAITLVLVGVLASIISDYIKIEKNPTKTLGAIAIKNANDLVGFLIEELLFFKEDRCYNYTIKARLQKYNDVFFQCIIEYEYTKKINHKKLEFKINRMYTDDHCREKKDENDVLKFERSIDFDERFFHEQTENLSYDDIKALYDITGLKVNVDNDEEKEFTLSMASRDGNRGTELVFSTEELPDKFVGKRVTLKYTVKCILEKTSYVYFDTDLPTKGFSLDFDYTDVVDEIDIDCVDFLSSYKCASIGDRPNDHRFRLSREDWVIPRSSFIVIWSEKKRKMTLKQKV